MPTTAGRSRGRQGMRSGTQGAVGEHLSKIMTALITGLVVIAFALVMTKPGQDIDAATQHFMLFYAGVFALIGLTASVGVGLVATDRIVMTPGHRVMAQAVHRAVSFGALAFLVIHIVTEILAQRAHVIDAFIPFLSPYRTFYIGLGTIASDLILLIIVTSIWRKRFTARGKAWRWRAIHYASYVAFVFGVLHGLLGGRAAKPYVDWSYGFAIALTALAVVVRFLAISLRSKDRVAAPPGADRAAGGLGYSGTSPLRSAALSAAQAQLRGTIQMLPTAVGAQGSGSGLPGSQAWAALPPAPDWAASSGPLPALPAGAGYAADPSLMPLGAPVYGESATAGTGSYPYPAAPGRQPLYEPEYDGPPRFQGAPRKHVPQDDLSSYPYAAQGRPPGRGNGGTGPLPLSPPPRAGSGPTPRAETGPMHRTNSGPMPRLEPGPMPRTDSGPMPRLGSGPMPIPGSGPTPRTDTGPMPRLARCLGWGRVRCPVPTPVRCLASGQARSPGVTLARCLASGQARCRYRGRARCPVPTPVRCLASGRARCPVPTPVRCLASGRERCPVPTPARCPGWGRVPCRAPTPAPCPGSGRALCRVPTPARRPGSSRVRYPTPTLARCPGSTPVPRGSVPVPGRAPTPARSPGPGRVRSPGPTPARCRGWDQARCRYQGRARCPAPTPAPRRGPGRARCRARIPAPLCGPGRARCRARIPAPCPGLDRARRPAPIPARCRGSILVPCRAPTPVPCRGSNQARRPAPTPARCPAGRPRRMARTTARRRGPARALKRITGRAPAPRPRRPPAGHAGRMPRIRGTATLPGAQEATSGDEPGRGA